MGRPHHPSHVHPRERQEVHRPNVDFYSGIIYQAMGLPVDMFPTLFAIGRTPGWLAQWEEGLLDPDQKISRPRQVYIAAGERRYVPVEERA